ncbi:MAG: hypothetical protein MZW92_24400 [Comamonadaceae bacterium]|nr:hypothetical protein [Comamonadaceae bacterium]
MRRLMLREGLRARRPRRFVRTTDSRHSFVPAPNVLGQRFQAEAPDPGLAGRHHLRGDRD